MTEYTRFAPDDRVRWKTHDMLATVIHLWLDGTVEIRLDEPFVIDGRRDYRHRTFRTAYAQEQELEMVE